MTLRFFLSAPIALVLAGPTASAQTANGSQPEIVVVTGAAPLPAFGLDPGKLPGETESLSIPQLAQDRTMSALPETAARELPEISISDEQGSAFQPDFVYRGFEASPIGGVAEGLAVYQNGVRLNESFGDNVNWDLVPEFAVQQFTVASNNPAFGLNALGGAVSLTMKDGFAFQGRHAQLSGGSYGRVAGDGEMGEQWGDWALYLGLGGSHDDGYRDASQSVLRQAYGDLGYARGRLIANLSVAGAWNGIDAPGPTPVQLLRANPRAVFTTPQSINNDMALVQLRAVYQSGRALLFSANLYYRRFSQTLVDGNTTDVEACLNDPAELCLEGSDRFPADALYDSLGMTVPASALPAGATPAEIDRTATQTNSYGAALQASWQSLPLGLWNLLVAGVSVDTGDTNYRAAGELGYLLANLHVLGANLTIDEALNPSASPPVESPVDVEAKNLYGGVYAIDTFDLTDSLNLSASGRLNLAQVSLDDLLHGAAGGSHGYVSLNPGAGLTYTLGDEARAYIGYSQSNRAPTAGELSCANPAAPCLLDAFLVADPSLRQVTSESYEMGLRGQANVAGGTVHWNASAYRTDVTDDILLVATNINGFGYFENAGETRRQGVDASLALKTPDGWNFRVAYNWLDAIFQSQLTVASNSPAANAQGFIQIVPGDRLPLNPMHRFTLSAEYAGGGWRVGADLRAESGQYLAGDPSNQEAELPAFATVDVHGSVALCDSLALFGEIDNLLGARYDTYGAFVALDHVPAALGLGNPRSVVPAPGREFFLGLRIND